LEEELSSEHILSDGSKPIDSLETGPGDTDLASNLVLEASKSIFNGTELDRSRGSSLDSSGLVVFLGRSRGAWDTGSKFTVLVLDWVVSVLNCQRIHKGGDKGNLHHIHTCLRA
jgi:hypothetical protein